MGFFNNLKNKVIEKAKKELMKAIGGGGKGTMLTKDEFEESKPDELRKDIRMTSGCMDKQTSADVSNVSSFCLPDPAGKCFLHR